ncbi:MAG: alpha/beta fold hydrolase [Polyangiaceae bacterium]
MTPPYPVHLPCLEHLEASVLVLHGYASHAEANRRDGATFVDARTEVIGVDAPGHGHRSDGRLEHQARLDDEARRQAIYDIAGEWATELPAIVEDCRQRGARQVGVVGISMGGLTALRSLHAPSSFDAVAAVLASPVLVDPDRLTPSDPPLLIGIAGRDEAVPPEPCRRFARSYGATLLEYPDSGHLMRGEDWHDLWSRVGDFLRRHL